MAHPGKEMALGLAGVGGSFRFLNKTHQADHGAHKNRHDGKYPYPCQNINHVLCPHNGLVLYIHTGYHRHGSILIKYG